MSGRDIKVYGNVRETSLYHAWGAENASSPRTSSLIDNGLEIDKLYMCLPL